MLRCGIIKTKYDMKHELDRMMDLIKDYKTGYGGVTDSFMRKELEMFAKDYYSEKCNIADVVGRSEQLKINKIKTFKKWKSEYATKIHNDLFLYNEVEVTSKKLKELYDAGVKLMS